jgi:hypothetical protein
MNSRLRWLAIVMAVALAPVAGAQSDISFAAGTDFRSLKTFAIRDGVIESDKLEINNRLFRQRLESSIRAALIKKGLREQPDKPDTWVTYTVRDKEVRAVQRLGPTRIPGSRGQGGAPDVVIQGPPATPVLYNEGVLVIDLSNASNSLLWRGTQQDRAGSAPKLSKQLSENARKLLAKFPPKK